MAKRLVILGSTGSIGCSALDVADALRDEWQIAGLGAGRRWENLAAQARRFHVPTVAIGDETVGGRLREACGNGTEVLAGSDALVKLVEREPSPDFVLSAVVGAAGLPATLAAVARGATVGLANKESLVIAGSILMPLARRTGARLLPIDSEHSAIFQALHSGRPAEVRKIYLTASGGPFREWPRERIENAPLEEALRHPTWQMGPKITIDSATLANKALEVIEACWLFDVRPEQVEVLIHPESIVHSMVEFCDGSIIAQLGTPDMRTPIQYALTYPARRNGRPSFLDWSQVKRLTFDQPDFERFPALRLGFEAARAGGTAGAVFNAANEAAVEAFRAGAMRFGDIPRAIENALTKHTIQTQPTLDALLAADRGARQEVAAWLNR
jgi:1-deoxy-D-xylulose-5-phosphate reductoisomerase